MNGLFSRTDEFKGGHEMRPIIELRPELSLVLQTPPIMRVR